ncbi:flippase [Pseudidiomarina marina]|uniref:flippase n=1 Tax=Pseudidiomarina marina TaxID=502366 RepID=UPI00384FFDF9
MSSSTLKKYLANTSWMFSDKVLSLALNFVVSIIIARYLGAEDYGTLAYVLSLTTIFTVAGHMGLSGLVVREIVNSKSEHDVILGTSYAIKMAGMLLGFIGLLAYAVLTELNNVTVFWMLIFASLPMLIQPITVLDFWFQSQVQARFTAISNTSGLVAASLFKLLLVFSGASVLFFALGNLIQSFVVMTLLIFFYKRSSSLSISEWRFDKNKAISLVKQSWLIFAGAIFAVIYMKIDQVMLKFFEGSTSVGIYAVAAQISEAWYFIPTIIAASIFPKLIQLRESTPNEFYRRLQQLFDILFIIGLVIAVITTFVAPFVINFLYGIEYLESANILVVHIWAGIFVALRAAFSKWILIENALVFSLVTQGAGALLNVVLNWILIPHFGAMGAAVSTLISYSVASFFALTLSSHTRPIFWMMFKAMFAPIRYPLSLSK